MKIDVFSEIIETEDPENIEEGIIYLIGENKNYWWTAFYCPCGCGDIIQLNLNKESKHSSWKYELNNNKITFSPSIKRLNHCKCQSHFFIKNNKVIWC